jgi:hypothetical protein
MKTKIPPMRFPIPSTHIPAFTSLAGATSRAARKGTLLLFYRAALLTGGGAAALPRAFRTLLFCAITTVTTLTAAPGDKVIWVDGDAIRSADLDGANSTPIWPNGGIDVAVNTTTGNIYWADNSSLLGTLMTGAHDGTGSAVPVTTTVPGERIHFIAIDPAGTGTAYWCDFNALHVYGFVLPDGPLIPIPTSAKTIRGIAVDSRADKRYLYVYNGSRLFRSDLPDGANEVLVDGGIGSGQPGEFALDTCADAVYVISATSPHPGVPNPYILRGELVYDTPPSVTNVTTVLSGPGAVGNTISGNSDIALDLNAGKMYWTSYNNNVVYQVHSAALDGSGNTVLPVPRGDTYRGIALFAPGCPPTPAAETINLSTRLRVDLGDNAGIGGFIITGSVAKHVVIRAIGPSLTGFGFPASQLLADPSLELHGPGSFATVMNNNWRDTQEAEIQATGLAPTNNLEAAIDATLSPGNYTAIVRGNGPGTGIALVEVYDVQTGISSKLANISTRALVGTGSNVAIAGFILGSNQGDDRIVARGIGPSLSSFGVPNPLQDPTLELRDQNGTLLVANNDWQDNNAQATEIAAAGLAPTDPRESAIAATLPAGLYTAILAGRNDTTGVGLVEVYDRGRP